MHRIPEVSRLRTHWLKHYLWTPNSAQSKRVGKKIEFFHNLGRTKNIPFFSVNGHLIFSNIHHKFLRKPVQVSVNCRDFLDLDTVLSLAKAVTLDIRRDPMVYGYVHFCTWNSETEISLANTTLFVEEYAVTTDEKGCASIFISLEAQKKTYRVSSPVPLKDSILTMPSGKDDVLLTK